MAVVVLEGIQPWRTNYTLAQVANQQINETRRIGQEYDRLAAQLYPVYVQASMTGNEGLANSVWSQIQKLQTEKNALFRSTFGLDPSGAYTHETDSDAFRTLMSQIGSAQTALSDIVKWKKQNQSQNQKSTSNSESKESAKETPDSSSQPNNNSPTNTITQGSGETLKSLLNAGQDFLKNNLGNIARIGLGMGLGGGVLNLANAIPGITGQNLFNNLGGQLMGLKSGGIGNINLSNPNLPTPQFLSQSGTNITFNSPLAPPNATNQPAGSPHQPSSSKPNATTQSSIPGPYNPPQSSPSQFVNQWLGLNKIFRVI